MAEKAVKTTLPPARYATKLAASKALTFLERQGRDTGPTLAQELP
jgi:hypothetical protein